LKNTVKKAGATISDTAGSAAGSRAKFRIKPDDIQHVLDTAARLFSLHGYSGVGIRDIARESGVTMPSIFYHFTSKEELYEETTAHQYAIAMARVEKVIHTRHPSPVKIEHFVNELFDMFFSDRAFFLLVQRDVADSAASRIPPRFQQNYQYVIGESQRMLSIAMGREVEVRDTFAVISLILGFCELTMIATKIKEPRDLEAWYRAQKLHLTSVVNRVLNV
jgi:AcrR family transcriptional regulator